jgi:hypothetical protein
MTDRTVLNAMQRYTLWGLIQKEYEAAKLPDPNFAKLATSRLGFKVTPGHVGAGRTALKINATMSRNSPMNPTGLNARVTAIEKALLALYTQLGWIPPKE